MIAGRSSAHRQGADSINEKTSFRASLYVWLDSALSVNCVIKGDGRRKSQGFRV